MTDIPRTKKEILGKIKGLMESQLFYGEEDIEIDPKRSAYEYGMAEAFRMSASIIEESIRVHGDIE